MKTKESLKKLQDAEKVFDLVQRLSSEDNAVASIACKEADDFLKQKCSDGFDRSVINKLDQPSKNLDDVTRKGGDVTAFMTAVAQDAQERAERRARQRERADKLKDRANTFFKAGNFKKAVELYSQAIDVAKDYDILYTNRAQAYLRLGQPDLSLKDCDTALLLFPEVQELNSNMKSTMVNNNRDIVSNPRLAKVYLHRGKALMSLNRPSEALSAYSLSRYYSASKTEKCTSTKLNSEKWPNYLIEYVLQAEAALIAQEADAKAEANFAQSAIGFKFNVNSENSNNIPSSQQLLSLLAQLARRNQNSRYYSAGLRYMNRLFMNAPKTKPTTITELNNTVHDSKIGPSESLNCNSETKKSNKKSKGAQHNSSMSDDSNIINCDNHLSTETLSDLQTIFRIKSGFSLLDKEVDAIYQIFNPDNICKKEMLIQQSNVVSSSTQNNNITESGREEDNGANETNYYSILDESERMLALLNLADHLTTNCAENQRLLIERQPNLIKITLACINLSPEFVQRITLHSSITPSSLSSENVNLTMEKQRSLHILGELRLAACNLLVNLTSLPSGRQSLLDMYGPGPILRSLASCLSTSMSNSYQVNSPTLTSTNISSLADAARGLVGRLSASSGLFNTTNSNNVDIAKSNLISSTIASVCATKAARILEYLTESSRFLILARSSSDGLQGLLSVIESALTSSSPTTNTNQPSSTTCQCLATLLDSLGNACQDRTFQKTILQSRKALLFGLSNCLSYHVPLLSDASHARLIASICRLLHNIYVGQSDQSIGTNNNSFNLPDTSNNDCSTSCLTSSKLVNSLLNSIGAILDQIGHGPELRAVVVALAGRLLPLCHDTNQLTSWFGENTTESISDLTPRTRLLLAILDSCSLDSCSKRNPVNPSTVTDEQQQQSNGNVSPSKNETNNITSHLITGCIRCLAFGTNHSINLRYAIGDDRRRVRRLARFIRARLSEYTLQSPSLCKLSVSSNQLPPRDEPLAGNVCLILQHCASDTPLAEHLQGTSVIYDLLSLIQESQRLDTKRNAAILIGKLAQSSQVHRDELSRLDGYSVLTPFNSWTAALERC
ncbi:unnamed protein product [Schistosoma rodhaini]|uniref:Heat shock protein 70 (Hsp70)-interacting protein, putative n=1 Tax=Schistosoma mansoni TaxID=6183 RepID=A0A3Q0KQH4_SCHMA|nr:unnamed protein product [Schistosoma rodhaini]